tara:strand:+ start:458 stop:694 length:237 start_codon:yes stop_codon:yes gene_type:complete
MNFFKKLNIYAFLIAFSIGIFMCYINQAETITLIRHPTPENAGKIIYQDKHQNCFKYLAEEVVCPEDKSKILNHPIEI